MNLYEGIKGRRHYLPESKVKHYMYELLKSIDHMHRNGIFHRDVKPENVLIMDDVIKLADLGSCRGIYSRQPYTEYISTRWYRAPECLLTDGYYSFKMDIFAAGCVWFEMIALFPLFPGQNEMDQIQKIHNVLGTPSPELLARKFKRNASHMDFNFAEKKGTGVERLIPHASPEMVELLKKLIKYDPDERILARTALKDAYFKDLRDAEKAAQGANAQVQSRDRDAPRSSAGSSNAGGGAGPEKGPGLSASSSSCSVGNSNENPEVTGGGVGAASDGEDVSQVAQPSQGVEKGGTLPTIGKQGGGGSKNPAGETQNPGATSGPFRALDNPGAGDEEDFDASDTMVLPPIGGLKGQPQKAGQGQGASSKSHGAKPPRAVKVGAGAALQKARGESGTYGGGERQGGQQISQSGASSSSKGFAGGNNSSSIAASPHISMSSTYGKKFGGTQASGNLGASASTLNQSRKYATGSSSMPPPQRGHGSHK
eukprot:gnl/MRDRNA2_/MRDRNA2_208437_c0_seq1.p1 gnl/MRDRNA2_/MRDRNA2_208437_c0~~gnl/MRDRNA2_/MRDRNA2_208437_c0_seq1.p1  ORF type:complete len:484 (-),score=105.58 gnl/MRDRNA2_/MRDRNA2_208437_c0_seq1:38-1489(-)